MVQHIVDGLVENRKNIREDGLDLYDSMAMDFLEQVERFGIQFPDLVLGEEQESDPSEMDKALELLRLAGAKFNTLVDMMQNQPLMNQTKLGLARAGRDNIRELAILMFGEEIADEKFPL